MLQWHLTSFPGARLFPLSLLLALLPLLFASVLPARTQDVVQWATNHYPVTGISLGELRQSMRENRPWKHTHPMDALTHWQVDWEFRTAAAAAASSGARCRVRSFRTTTRVTISLPRWTTRTNAPEAVVRAWDRYITALERHEAGHGQFALAAADEVRRRAARVSAEAPADVDCGSLRDRLNAQCLEVMTEYREKDRQYDVVTRHGATQGAVLKLFPD
jgi:predicted secreted Zn-dependent protease